MKTLYIVRGLPGSGKTSVARKLVEDPSHMCAADDYFHYMSEDGSYDFKPAQIKEAHTWCQESVALQMAIGTEAIAVHNTFSQNWEMKAYVKLAEQNSYSVFVLECQNKYENIHGVPNETITRMAERWEPLTLENQV